MLGATSSRRHQGEPFAATGRTLRRTGVIDSRGWPSCSVARASWPISAPFSTAPRGRGRSWSRAAQGSARRRSGAGARRRPAARGSERPRRVQPRPRPRSRSPRSSTSCRSSPTRCCRRWPRPRRGRSSRCCSAPSRIARAAMHLLVSVAVLRALEETARAGPLILAVDDLQWLDEPSARALGFALRRLDESPVWLVATRRRERGAAPRRLEDALGADLVHRIELGPMDLDALGLMLRERLGLALPRARLRAVLERSGGTRSTPSSSAASSARARAWRRARPPSLRRRSRSWWRTGWAASMAPCGGCCFRSPRSRGRRWRRSTRLPNLLERAVAAGLLERAGDALRFAHPLYGSAIYSAASAVERRAVHEDLAGRVADPAERALHLGLAAERPDEGLAAHLERTAAEVSERGAPDAAADLARQARRLTPDGDRAAGGQARPRRRRPPRRRGRRACGDGAARRAGRLPSGRSPPGRGALAAGGRRGRGLPRGLRAAVAHPRGRARRGRRGAGPVRPHRARAGDHRGERGRRGRLPAPRRGGGGVRPGGSRRRAARPTRCPSSGSQGSSPGAASTRRSWAGRSS